MTGKPADGVHVLEHLGGGWRLEYPAVRDL